jgi:hypothetical protein
VVAKRAGWKLCIADGDQYVAVFCITVFFEKVKVKNKALIK